MMVLFVHFNIWRATLHLLYTLQTVCGYGAQDALPFRPLKEGELFFVEDREINLVELALATNIPKGCAETMVRGKTGIATEIYPDLLSLEFLKRFM